MSTKFCRKVIEINSGQHYRWNKTRKDESAYSSRHISTPEYERSAQEIVNKHEKLARDVSSDLLKSHNEITIIPGYDNMKSSLYSSR